MTDVLLNTLISGLTGLTVAGGAIFVQWYQARVEREKRRAEIEAAAREAKETLAREVRRDSLAEWQGLADERKGEIAALKAEDADQQKQIDAMKTDLADCQKQHEECEEKHAERDAADSKRDAEIKSLHATLKNSGDRIADLERKTGPSAGSNGGW